MTPCWTSYTRSRAEPRTLKERLKLLRQFEKRVLDEKAYQFDLPSGGSVSCRIGQNERLEDHPSHYVNQDLRDVWLAE